MRCLKWPRPSHSDFRLREVATWTGAGDTVIATMTLAIAAGAVLRGRAACQLPGGIVVMKRGTATGRVGGTREAVSGQGQRAKRRGLSDGACV